MLRGELHNRGSAGRREACGEIFPCATALAILAAVKNDVEQLTSSQRVTDGAHCPACGSVNIGETNIRPAGWLDPRSCRDCHVTFDSSRR
jgi:transposase-like protein